MKMDQKKINELLEQEGFIQWLFTSSPESPWNSWYKQNLENRQLADKLRTELKSFPLKGDDAERVNKFLLRNRITETIARSTSANRRGYLLKVTKWAAAAALVGIISVSALILNGRKLIVTPNGAQQAIVLPDGSKVKLNSGSSLAYNSFLWKFTPSVTLEGEGYFYGNHQKGFGVKTSIGEVKVLGTQFNVYSRNTKYRVECYQGKIQVGTSLLNKHEILEVGECISADMQSKKVHRELLYSQITEPRWTSGEFYFEKARFEDVLNELERQFNIKFARKDSFKNLSYTGYFNTKDVNVALKMTLSPLGIGYKTSRNEIILTEKE